MEAGDANPGECANSPPTNAAPQNDLCTASSGLGWRSRKGVANSRSCCMKSLLAVSSDARGTAASPVASPAASSEYSEAFETDDESFAVGDAEVGASCFFDDVCNHGVAEKRRHLALDGGMEEMRRRIERMEVSLREGGIVPA